MLRHFTIRQRLAAAFLSPVLLMALLGGAAVWVARLQNQAFNDYNERVAQTAQLSLQLQVAMVQMRRFEKDAALSLVFPEKSKDYVARWTKESVRAEALLTQIEAHLDDTQGKQRMAAVRAGFVAYRDAARPVLDKVLAVGYGSPDDVHAATRDASRHHAGADKALGETLASVDKLTEAASAKVNGLYSSILFGALAVVLAACVLLGAAGWFIGRSIVVPMREATAFAGRIRDGDLAATLAAEGRDETADLTRTMLQMQTQLARIVGAVRQSADRIQTASTEVASGNADLSQRTEEAASNLQQTASSMALLTDTVRQSASSAQTANQLAVSAAGVAQHGGGVVANVVATMTEIHASSKKIADIIGTIDGIAFQTNILALNAAVEAARAGEQGRGFAVVAGEVRSLAQRSAEAAKQIKGLIGASVERVEAGSRLVADAGTAMTDIVASVQRVTDIIGEISAAATEQSQGIDQVNAAVTQLDQMTQQNAALVEQSAAAAESLKDQAAKLSGMVATFKLEAAEASRPAPQDIPTLPLQTIVRTIVAAPAPAAAHERKAAEVIERARHAAPATASRADDGDWESF